MSERAFNLEAYEESGVFGDPVQCRALMLELAGLLRLTSPERCGLEVGRGYVDGSETAAALEHARVEAWRNLGHRSCCFNDPEVNRTRTVICTLYPMSAEGAVFDEFTNFAEFFLAAGGSNAALHRAIEPTHPGL